MIVCDFLNRPFKYYFSVNKLHPAVVSEVEEAVCDVFQENSVILCRYNVSRIHCDVETSGEETHTHTHTRFLNYYFRKQCICFIISVI